MSLEPRAELQDKEEVTSIVRRNGMILITVLGVLMSVFQLYSGLFGSQTAMFQRSIHLGFVLAITFLVCPAIKNKAQSQYVLALDLFLALLAIVVNLYILLEYEQITITRMGIPNSVDVAMGIITVLLVLEATRRTPAWAIAIIGVVFIAYGLFGHLIPGALGHRLYALSRIIHQLYLTTEGIYGVVLGASANYIFLFVLFAAFLRITKAGDFISDLTLAAFGHVRGGPAKAAIGASCLFGAVSMAATANVASVGTITIPLMKRIGYRPEFAGAVEAAASTGDQFMPPIMAASAFVMAEILGIPYGEICVRAVVPALLYFFAIFVMVDYEALKAGLKGLPKGDLPSLRKVLKEGWYMLSPVILLLVVLMFLHWSCQRGAFVAIVVTVLLSFVRKSTRIKLKDAIAAMREGAVSASVDIGCLCASAGIIIAIISLTGLGMKLSSLLANLAGGSLPLLLVLGMITALILGMGLPPVACYVLLAVLIAPTMVDMGVLPVAAHLFVYYFGMLAVITPPVGAAFYVAAGIAGANPWKTGWYAFLLATAGFLLPYAFVYEPTLLLIGRPLPVIESVIAATISVVALASALQGQYYWFKTNWIERVLLFASAITLLIPSLYLHLCGLTTMIIITFEQIIRYRRKGKTELLVTG